MSVDIVETQLGALHTTPVTGRGARRGPADYGRLAGRLVIVLLLIAFALVFLYPFAWLISASLKPRENVFDNSLLPSPVKWSNYADVWDQLPLLHWMFNSITIAFLAATAVAVSSSVVA